MTAPNPNTNVNNPTAIDPNDPYSTIKQEQPILRDPESDIIAKAMEYYNTEATELSSPNSNPQIVVPSSNFSNHDYHDGVNPQAESQLNNLYQKSAFVKGDAPDTVTANPIQDSNHVYESVTYPEANFQNYKSVYNPNQANSEISTVVEGVSNPDTYLDSSILTTSVVNDNAERHLDEITTINDGKSRRWLWILLSAVLILLFIGLGGYTWWIASQRSVSTSNSSTSISSVQNSSEITSSSEPTRSTRSVAVVFNDANGPKPADIAKKENFEALTSEFLKQNFDSTKLSEDKCIEESLCGKDADTDKDGLTNLQEQTYKTNPNKVDSDEDKIADGDEVNIYGTDPTKSDSTNSGYSDFDKVKACNDPAFKFTNMPNKFSPERQKQLIENITKFQLHETTINSLKAIGATDSDLKTGTLAESCSPVNIKL